eukprot:CAMPEP_0114307430 /NCGR_PEP_ID=MMETSP0059-20121206/17463_1 /TAXON_ID=36894 /ORGANISM="Pyramimonas parkeae, Strain CCMP726" /LENGTH=354 /DNA_ID=CAMNT_0001430889 /DNA_START=478 /DNA_END=1542 /DNA_ORIENTATION=-
MGSPDEKPRIIDARGHEIGRSSCKNDGYHAVRKEHSDTVSDLMYYKSNQLRCQSYTSNPVCSNSGGGPHTGPYADLYRWGSSDLFGSPSDIHNDLFSSTRQTRMSCPGHFPGDSTKLQQGIQQLQLQRHAKSFHNRRTSENDDCGPDVSTTRIARTDSSRMEIVIANEVDDGGPMMDCSLQSPSQPKALSGGGRFHGRVREHSMFFEGDDNVVRMLHAEPNVGHRDYSDLYRGGISHYMSPLSSSVPRATSNLGPKSMLFSPAEDLTARKSSSGTHREGSAVGHAMKPRRSLQHPPPDIPGSCWQKQTRVCISPSAPPRKSMSQSPCWPSVQEESDQGDWQPMSMSDMKDLLKS